jgi:hypothetical protein
MVFKGSLIFMAFNEEQPVDGWPVVNHDHLTHSVRLSEGQGH